MPKRITLLIPLTFNDGSAVPRKTLRLIRDQIYAEFNGCTVVGTVEGTYRMRSTGKKQVDKLLQVWVVIDEERISQLRRMAGEWCARLGQESMYFEIADSHVEFVPAVEDKETSDE